MNFLHHHPLNFDWPASPIGSESEPSGVAVLLKAQYAWMAAVGMPALPESGPEDTGELVEP